MDSTRRQVISFFIFQVQSFSAFEDNLSGVGSSFQNLTKEVRNTDTELQELKNNIESKIKSSSADGKCK